MTLQQAAIIFSFLGALVAGAQMWQYHLDTDSRRDRQILQLQHIVVGEWTDYTKTIDWVDK